MSKLKKQQLIQKDDPQVIYRKNRNRLMEQNRQLYSEIYRLESKVSAVLTKNLNNEFKEKIQDQKLVLKHKQLTESQKSQIKKLKKKILLIKNSDKHQQKQDLRQALDELVFLKKQKEKFVIQKEALIKSRRLKEEGLQLNKPLEEEQKNLMILYKSTQHQNFDLRSKMVKIQRQISNLHKAKELAKNVAAKPSDEDDFELKKIEDELRRVQGEIRQIEKQWQPRIESLTTEYFLLKEIKQEKDNQISQLEKTIRTFEHRVTAMREQEKILQDRARLSQVVISAQKRQQISQIYQAEKERQEFFKQFKIGSRDQAIKLPELKQQKTKKSRSKSPKIKANKSLLQTEPVKLFEAPPKVNKYKQSEPVLLDQKQFEQNEFASIKQNIEQVQNNKPMKHLVSVAVGTTFYYNEEEENE